MSIMSYNGGTVVAMAGEDCVCIGTDLRLGEDRDLIATDVKKVRSIFVLTECRGLLWLAGAQAK